MAVAYGSELGLTAITSVSTTEKFIHTADGWQSLAPNYLASIAVASGTHANDDITVTLYGSNDAGTTNFAIKSFQIAAGDTDQHLVASLAGVPHWDVGVVASGSSDTPTLTFKAKIGPLNGA